MLQLVSKGMPYIWCNTLWAQIGFSVLHFTLFIPVTIAIVELHFRNHPTPPHRDAWYIHLGDIGHSNECLRNFVLQWAVVAIESTCSVAPSWPWCRNWRTRLSDIGEACISRMYPWFYRYYLIDSVQKFQLKVSDNWVLSAYIVSCCSPPGRLLSVWVT